MVDPDSMTPSASKGSISSLNATNPSNTDFVNASNSGAGVSVRNLRLDTLENAALKKTLLLPPDMGRNKSEAEEESENEDDGDESMPLDDIIRKSSGRHTNPQQLFHGEEFKSSSPSSSPTPSPTQTMRYGRQEGKDQHGDSAVNVRNIRFDTVENAQLKESLKGFDCDRLMLWVKVLYFAADLPPLSSVSLSFNIESKSTSSRPLTTQYPVCSENKGKILTYHTILRARAPPAEEIADSKVILTARSETKEVGRGELQFSELLKNTPSNYRDHLVDVEVPITLRNSFGKVCGRINTKIFFVKGSDYQDLELTGVLNALVEDADDAQRLAVEQYEKLIKQKERRRSTLNAEKRKRSTEGGASPNMNSKKQLSPRSPSIAQSHQSHHQSHQSQYQSLSPSESQEHSNIPPLSIPSPASPAYDENTLSSLNYSPSPNKQSQISPTISNNEMMATLSPFTQHPNDLSAEVMPSIMKELSNTVRMLAETAKGLQEQQQEQMQQQLILQQNRKQQSITSPTISPSAIMTAPDSEDPSPPTPTRAQSPFPIHGALDWTVDDVASWLKKSDFSGYVKQFKNESIDGLQLVSLTDSQLDNLGFLNANHKQRIKLHISRLRGIFKDEIEQIEKLMGKEEGNALLPLHDKGVDSNHSRQRMIAASSERTKKKSPASKARRRDKGVDSNHSRQRMIAASSEKTMKKSPASKARSRSPKKLRKPSVKEEVTSAAEEPTRIALVKKKRKKRGGGEGEIPPKENPKTKEEKVDGLVKFAEAGATHEKT